MNLKHGDASMPMKLTMGQFNLQEISPEAGLSCENHAHAGIYQECLKLEFPVLTEKCEKVYKKVLIRDSVDF